VTAFGVGVLFLAVLVAVLGLFTAIQIKRIEKRFPPVGDLVAINGGVIHIVEAAAQDAARGVVLLLHGASGNQADMALALAAPLAALGFHVIAVDRPGHGWSARFFGRPASSPAAQAALIRAALAERGVDRAIVVGHSLSGALALTLALETPDFVRALVLLAPVSHPWPGGVNWHYTASSIPWLGSVFRWLIVMPAGLLSLRAGVRQVFAPNATQRAYVEATGLKLMLRPRHFQANAEDVIDLKPFVIEQSRRYATIAAPTEIVTGDTDGVVSRELHSAGCARDIPGAVLTVLPGVGHSPHHAATESVIAAILRAEARAIAAEAAPIEARIAAAR
jgi:pimeloyl-ACP methyl ester carboxylesterase